MRYVVLHHTGWNEDHFDLMLEADTDGPLLTWRLDAFPAPTRVQLLANHRRDYLTYEGDVSNGRGRVRRVAEGEYVVKDKTVADFLVFLTDSVVSLRLPLS